jgi:hypothetical protein
MPVPGIRPNPLCASRSRGGVTDLPELNDVPTLRADVDQAERFILDIDSGELDEVAEIA